MDLSIQKLNKSFNQKIVFKDLTFSIRSGDHFAITGSNGTGKSTLLKIISGGALPSSGVIRYSINGNDIEQDNLYRYVHFVAPYNTVIEELTLRELFDLHQRLGLLRLYHAFHDWFLRLDYPFNPDQQIKMYSSGMKQRIKLGLSLLDDRPLILLDEPGSNLDLQGKSWLHSMLGNLTKDQTLVIASNDPVEIGYCAGQFNLGNHN
jgi:ABC-type multidrug transport system ATPase subunit